MEGAGRGIMSDQGEIALGEEKLEEEEKRLSWVQSS